MIFNFILGIWCYNCNKYLDSYTEVYHNFLYEGSLTCEKDHLIGNESDPQWQDYFYNYKCPYYYFYHEKGQCRCIQEETNCEGLTYYCENSNGKKAYENDLKEKNDNNQNN